MSSPGDSPAVSSNDPQYCTSKHVQQHQSKIRCWFTHAIRVTDGATSLRARCAYLRTQRSHRPTSGIHMLDCTYQVLEHLSQAEHVTRGSRNGGRIVGQVQGQQNHPCHDSARRIFRACPASSTTTPPLVSSEPVTGLMSRCTLPASCHAGGPCNQSGTSDGERGDNFNTTIPHGTTELTSDNCFNFWSVLTASRRNVWYPFQAQRHACHSSTSVVS